MRTQLYQSGADLRLTISRIVRGMPRGNFRGIYIVPVPSTPILFGSLLFWIAFPAVGLLLNASLDLSDVLESFAYVALPIVVATKLPVHNLSVGIGYLRTGSIMTIIGMLLLGQFADRERLTYPFTPWSMFCGANPPPHYFEYMAEASSGVVGHFPFEELTAFREPRQLIGAFDNLASDLAATRRFHPRFQEYRELQRSISLVGKAYNKLRPDNQMFAISVYTMSVPITTYIGRNSIRRELLVRVEL